jgi:acyl carrier protein
MPPLMPLMAWRLVELALQQPAVNATIVGGRRYRYAGVNLGFTVQADRTLYLTVVRGAEAMDAPRFIDAMGGLQRRAMAHRLAPAEMSGATIAFTSMARWNVSRHVPILPPHTGLIVAHSAPRASGRMVLGASYDHRLLSGFDVVQLLQALAQPPQASGHPETLARRHSRTPQASIVHRRDRMTLDRDAVKAAIRDKVIALARALGMDASEIADDDIIPATGLLDSTAVLELVVWYEQTFDLPLSQDEINIDNLGSIDAMAGFLLPQVGRHIRLGPGRGAGASRDGLSA